MNKRLITKYKLLKRLYEIEISIEIKYGTESSQIEHLIINTSSNENAIAASLSEFNEVYGSTTKMYLHLINQYQNENLTTHLLNYWMFILLVSKNDAISPETEEFWEQVKLENIKVKRKNNRLLNILKKGYVGGDFDREIFYFGINKLIKSEVFKRVYSKDIEDEINLFIKNQTERLITNGETIIRKKKKSVKDLYKLEDIIIQFQRYNLVLKISVEKLELFKVEQIKMKAYL